jgi:ribosomal protein S8
MLTVAIDYSKVVEFLLDVLEKAGYIEMKTDFAL